MLHAESGRAWNQKSYDFASWWCEDQPAVISLFEKPAFADHALPFTSIFLPIVYKDYTTLSCKHLNHTCTSRSLAIRALKILVTFDAPCLLVGLSTHYITHMNCDTRPSHFPAHDQWWVCCDIEAIANCTHPSNWKEAFAVSVFHWEFIREQGRQSRLANDTRTFEQSISNESHTMKSIKNHLTPYFRHINEIHVCMVTNRQQTEQLSYPLRMSQG